MRCSRSSTSGRRHRLARDRHFSSLPVSRVLFPNPQRPRRRRHPGGGRASLFRRRDSKDDRSAPASRWMTILVERCLEPVSAAYWKETGDDNAYQYTSRLGDAWERYSTQWKVGRQSERRRVCPPRSGSIETPNGSRGGVSLLSSREAKGAFFPRCSCSMLGASLSVGDAERQRSSDDRAREALRTVSPIGRSRSIARGPLGGSSWRNTICSTYPHPLARRSPRHGAEDVCRRGIPAPSRCFNGRFPMPLTSKRAPIQKHRHRSLCEEVGGRRFHPISRRGSMP